MNVVDSSGWLEYFGGGRNAARFAAPLKDTPSLIVPTVCLYEVFKVLLRERGENAALQAASAMQRGTVLNLTPELAMSAASLSLEHRLPMADSVILASARASEATVWTQDIHFKGIAGVRFFQKR